MARPWQNGWPIFPAAIAANGGPSVMRPRISLYGTALGVVRYKHSGMPRRENKFDNPTPPSRSAVRPGVAVWVIEKEHYGTQNYKQGIVQNVLTSMPNHPRGIKVRLTDGTIGRVQWLVED